jgi:hypothetical protein
MPYYYQGPDLKDHRFASTGPLFWKDPEIIVTFVNLKLLPTI